MAACSEKNALWGKILEASGSKLSEAPPARDFTVESDGYGYEPAMGRACWPSRDPIGEQGGVNLYEMVGNDAISQTDYLGQLTLIHYAVIFSVVVGVTYAIKVSFDKKTEKELNKCGCKEILAAARANAQARRGLLRILLSEGVQTFEQNGLSLGGTFSVALSNGEPGQNARDIFENVKNTKAYKSAMEELAARAASGFTKVERYMAYGEREALATAMLNRLGILQTQLVKAASEVCKPEDYNTDYQYP